MSPSRSISANLPVLKDAGSRPSDHCERPTALTFLRAKANGRVSLNSRLGLSSKLEGVRRMSAYYSEAIWHWQRLATIGLALMAVAIAGCSSPKIEGKIGLVDPGRLLNDSNAGKKAKDSLAAFAKNRQTLIEMEEKELRRMEEDFIKQASVLSPAAKSEREQAFRRRMAEYQQKAGELNREVQEKQKDVLDAFRDKVERSEERR